MNCPICHTPIINPKETLFCPNCCWELVFLPSTASPEQKRLFETKTENYREGHALLEETKRLRTENESLRERIETLRQIKAIHQKEAELQSAKDKLASLEKAMGKVEEYQEQMKKLLEVYIQTCCRGHGNKPIIMEIKNFLTERGML